MPAKTGSRNGLSYGWSLGENNWNTGMDGNLTFIDRFGLHLSFKSFLNTPPGSPAAGDCHVVGSAPTGAWVGRAGQVAVYDDGAWRYGIPRTGWQAYCEADDGRYVFDGAWNLLAVGDISGLSGALDGKADLVGGVVPSSQLPSYVDDVIEVANFAALPATGEAGKIYVTLSDNNSWRWTGSTYQKVSQPLDEMPQAVAEAGTSETLYAATARRIRQAITAWWLTASTAFGRTLANVADAAAGRTALGLGTIATQDAASVAVGTLSATGQVRSESSVLAAAGAPVYLGNAEDASVAELSSPSPFVVKVKTAGLDTLTVSALTGNTSHVALNIDTAPAANFLMFRQAGALGAILGSEASVFGANPDNYGTYLYDGSEYFVAVGAAKRLRVLSDGIDVIGKLTTSNIKEDGAGNVGVGAGAPKPWAVGKAIDVGLAGAFFGDGINASWSAGIAQNAYASAYPGTWAYKATGIGASRYQCNENLHQWSSAPAGVAGEPVPFNLDMVLQYGRLLIGDLAQPLGSVNLSVANGVQANNTSGGGFAAVAKPGGGVDWYNYTGAVGAESYALAVTLDDAGNFGLGVTPSQWGGYRALQVGPGASLSSSNPNSAVISTSAYNESGGGWKRVYSGVATAQYELFNGGHYWSTAPSGNAGDPISFTQAMTLDAAGVLAIAALPANEFPNDAAAAADGVPIGGLYHTDGTVKVRLS